MIPAHELRITVGSVIRVAEADYCYGLGELILRVIEIGAIQRDGGEPWVALRGIQLRSNGAEGVERSALVRVAALSSRSGRANAPQDEA